ncbi:hypothetical protein GOBAR_AA17607 [Gossypium barbadense]|uniref:Ribosomal protein L34e superfamily protein n=1 Tax=Gossypium barbadense TaxID=3634 RepID=A0A2P5XIB7_GOSBA|nr:hypothetical protein GOBAR_AA17607 [Gossypium barbadense]
MERWQLSVPLQNTSKVAFTYLRNFFLIRLLSLFQKLVFCAFTAKPNLMSYVFASLLYLNVAPSCERSRSAAIDVVILIAVIAACGFLLYPTIKCLSLKLIEFIGTAFYVIGEEIMRAPMIYGSIGLGFSCAAIAAWILLLCTTKKCRNPNCKGLRKAAEFDIQLETEECVKNSSTLVKDGVKKGLFELPRDHHKELEAELKKMAPVNGRAVLVFRARCGCSVGRLEVPGPKKQRKIKK